MGRINVTSLIFAGALVPNVTKQCGVTCLGRARTCLGQHGNECLASARLLEPQGNELSLIHI